MHETKNSYSNPLKVVYFLCCVDIGFELIILVYLIWKKILYVCIDVKTFLNEILRTDQKGRKKNNNNLLLFFHTSYN